MELAPGDIIQITSEQHRWYATLLIVTEVRRWGVIACLLIPDPIGNVGPAYTRVGNEDFVKVGSAQIVLTGEEQANGA